MLSTFKWDQDGAMTWQDLDLDSQLVFQELVEPVGYDLCELVVTVGRRNVFEWTPTSEDIDRTVSALANLLVRGLAKMSQRQPEGTWRALTTEEALIVTSQLDYWWPDPGDESALSYSVSGTELTQVVMKEIPGTWPWVS